ncbi:MAG TPA: polysaccharide deacetylase family protein, partial [Anaerolineales bacterium]|nr:polysaccharide deacetylase family protein [Anaerolineales bacterium]
MTHMVLTYHRITPEPSSYLYSVTRDQLDAHLAVVAELQDPSGPAGASPRVTFDDGHRSNYDHGLDLLAKHSLRATFFVIAGWMSARDDFMSWPELRELVSLGHEVQAHGWSHRVLPGCSASELEDELLRSKRTMEDQLNVPVEAISIPHGRWDDRVLRACAAAGYRRVYISNPWMRPQQREGVELLGRYMV